MIRWGEVDALVGHGLYSPLRALNPRAVVDSKYHGVSSPILYVNPSRARGRYVCVAVISCSLLSIANSGWADESITELGESLEIEWQSDPESLAVLESVVLAYGSMMTFRCEGVLESGQSEEPSWKIDLPTGGENENWKMPVEIVYASPDRIKVSWKERFRSEQEFAVVLFTRDGFYYLYRELHQKYQKFNSLRDAVFASMQVPNFHAIFQWELLSERMRRNLMLRASNIGNLRYRGVESVDGLLCHRIEGDFSNASTIWVHRDLHVVVQVENSNATAKVEWRRGGLTPRRPSVWDTNFNRRDWKILYSNIRLSGYVANEDVDFELPVEAGERDSRKNW